MKFYLLIAVILQVVWGLVPSASQFVIDEIPVELYIALRWSISGFIFAIYLFLTKSWQKISLSDFLWVAFLGVLGYGLASLGTLYGLKVGGVSNFGLMSSLGPVISSVAAIFILKEKPNRLFYFALPVVVLGLVCLIYGKFEVSTLRIAGLSAMLILGGYTLEAIVFVSSKRFKPKMSTFQYLAIAQGSTAIVLWFSQAAFFHQTSEIQNLRWHGILAASFVSIVACVFCYAVLYWLLNHIDGHRLALFEGLHALSSTAFGYLIFREPLRPLMLIGGLFILAGLVAGNWPKSTQIDGDQ